MSAPHEREGRLLPLCDFAINPPIELFLLCEALKDFEALLILILSILSRTRESAPLHLLPILEYLSRVPVTLPCTGHHTSEIAASVLTGQMLSAQHSLSQDVPGPGSAGVCTVFVQHVPECLYA
jgi:hypothetical protein